MVVFTPATLVLEVAEVVLVDVTFKFAVEEAILALFGQEDHYCW